MRRGNWKTVALRDFSGGRVTNKAAHALNANEWAELSNVRLSKDGTQAEKRGGTTVKTGQMLRYD